jgi:hypothetical protein
MPRVSLPTADRARVHDPAHGTCSHHRANRWSCRRCGRPRTRPRPTEQRRETVGGPLRARPRDQRASHPGANRLGPVRRTRVGHRLRRALRDRFPDRLDDDLPQRLPDVHRCFLSSAPAADRSTGAHRLPGSTHVRGGQAHPAAGLDTVAAMAAVSESSRVGAGSRGGPSREHPGTEVPTPPQRTWAPAVVPRPARAQCQRYGCAVASACSGVRGHITRGRVDVHEGRHGEDARAADGALPCVRWSRPPHVHL